MSCIGQCAAGRRRRRDDYSARRAVGRPGDGRTDLPGAIDRQTAKTQLVRPALRLARWASSSRPLPAGRIGLTACRDLTKLYAARVLAAGPGPASVAPEPTNYLSGARSSNAAICHRSRFVRWTVRNLRDNLTESLCPTLSLSLSLFVFPYLSTAHCGGSGEVCYPRLPGLRCCASTNLLLSLV